MKSLVVLLCYVFVTNFANGIPQRFAGRGMSNNINYNPIVYPSEDTNKNHTSTHNKQPVVDRKRCNAESELLYPGDNDADWVCDCRPGYLYLPQMQKCYQAYTKGSCPNEYLIFKDKDSNIPKCVQNPCRRDGYVFFKNACYQLNGEEACEDYSKLIGRKVILSVNPTTLELQCRDEGDNFACSNFCCLGGIRDSIGKCDKQ